jgi:hypothetical protein
VVFVPVLSFRHVADPLVCQNQPMVGQKLPLVGF